MNIYLKRYLNEFPDNNDINIQILKLKHIQWEYVSNYLPYLHHYTILYLLNQNPPLFFINYCINTQNITLLIKSAIKINVTFDLFLKSLNFSSFSKNYILSHCKSVSNINIYVKKYANKQDLTYIALNKNIDNQLFYYLFNMNDYNITLNLLLNPNIPLELMYKVWNSNKKDKKVGISLAKNKSTPIDILESYKNFNIYRIVYNIMLHPNGTEELTNYIICKNYIKNYFSLSLTFPFTKSFFQNI